MNWSRLATATAIVVDPHPGDYASLEVPRGTSELKSCYLTRLIQSRSGLNTDRAMGLDGFRIRYLTNGQSALRASQRDAALWLINTRLPDMTGFDLFEMLSSSLLKTPVFFVANDYSDAEERESFRLGAAKFCCKPVTASWLAGLRCIHPVRSVSSVFSASPIRSANSVRQTHPIHEGPLFERPPPPGATPFGHTPVYLKELDDT